MPRLGPIRLAPKLPHACAFQDQGQHEWLPPSSYALHYSQLQGDLQVGGVYLTNFLKDPTFRLTDSKHFADSLVQQLLQAIATHTGSRPAKAGGTAPEAGSAGQPPPDAAASPPAHSVENVQLMSAAAVALLAANPLLADHLAGLGYLPKLTAQLGKVAAMAPAGGGGGDEGIPAEPAQLAMSLLRLLHQLASNAAAAEAVSVATSKAAVGQLMALLSWGPMEGTLVLETLKRWLSPINRHKDMLVAACLQAGVIRELLAMLDWKKGARDAAAAEAPGSGSTFGAASRGSDSAGDNNGSFRGSSGGSGGPKGIERGALQLQSRSEEHHRAVLRALAAEVLRALSAEGSYKAEVRSV